LTPKAKTNPANQHASSEELEMSLSLEKSGFLLKKTDVVKAWRERWFLLRGKYLFYVKSVTDDLNQPKGVIELDSCNVSPVRSDAKKRRFCFCISHSRRQSYWLCAFSESEMQSWINAIAAAIRYFSRTIFLEYRGQEIVDPEDAKEIAQANADVKQFVFQEYEAAHLRLLEVAKKLTDATSRHQKVYTQTRRLTKKIKALRQQLVDQQASYSRLSQQLADLHAAKKRNDRSRRALMSSVADLHIGLEQTDPQILSRHLLTNASLARSALKTLSSLNMLTEESLDGSSTGPLSGAQIESLDDADALAKVQNFSESQLLALSQKQLETLHLEIQSLTGLEHIQLRHEYLSSLSANAAMRIKMNNYAEHILILTQRKLEQFDQQFDQTQSVS